MHTLLGLEMYSSHFGLFYLSMLCVRCLSNDGVEDVAHTLAALAGLLQEIVITVTDSCRMVIFQ